MKGDCDLELLQVFLEPQTSSGVESTLREYADAVKTLVCFNNHLSVHSQCSCIC